MKIHYSKVVIFDLIIQLDYDHVIQITKLSDISLSLRSFNQNNLINSNLALFLISNQVPDFRFKAELLTCIFTLISRSIVSPICHLYRDICRVSNITG